MQIGSILTCIVGIVLCRQTLHSFIARASICVLTYSPEAAADGHSAADGSREWACLDCRPMNVSVPSGLGCFCQTSLIPSS